MIFNNKSDKVLNFLKNYISHDGESRKTYMDPGSIFTPKEIKSFCNTEGIQITYSQVKRSLSHRLRRTHDR